MKSLWNKYRLIATLLLAVGSGLVVGYMVHPSTKVVKIPQTTIKTQTVTNEVKQSEPAYRIGDTQTQSNIAIKLDKVYTVTQADTAKPLQPGTVLFAIQLTITNNGSMPAKQGNYDGAAPASFIYTDDGKYIHPDQSGAAEAGCFSGTIHDVPAHQSVTSCVMFSVSPNTVVDTYFYNDLKWYL